MPMASATGTLAAPTSIAPAPSLAWLRNPQFDFTLIVVVASWALAAGAAVVVEPSLFWPILFLDVWLLGYTHVVSTFTRLAFDRESFRQHRLLLIPLPVVVAAFTIAIALLVGEWLVASVYLYAQWFHYTRQSYGISRMYLAKGRLDSFLARLGIRRGDLRAAALGHPLSIPSAAGFVPELVRLYLSGPFCPRLRRRHPGLGQRNSVGRAGITGLWPPAGPMPHTQRSMASHIAIFSAGYLLIADINTGWLVLNIWHNLQYMLIVWMFNANRFGKGVDPQRRFLSTISQPRNVLLYAFVCWAIGSILYFNIDGVLGLLSESVLPLSLLAYMTINFHHYVVDAIIWRRPRRSASTADA